MPPFDLGDIVAANAVYERAPLVPDEDARMERKPAAIIGTIVGVSRRFTEGKVEWRAAGEDDVIHGIDWQKESRKTFYLIRQTLRGRMHLALPEDMEIAALRFTPGHREEIDNDP